MKKLYLFTLLIYLSALFQETSGQSIVINSGTAGTPAYNSGPVYRSSASSGYDYSRYAYLYTGSELATAGLAGASTITELGWVKDNTTTTNGGALFKIYLKNSSAADYNTASEPWTTLTAGATLVYDNTNQSIPATAAPDYIMFTLNTPFAYTGGALEVFVEWDISGVSGNPTTGTFNWLWSTVPDRIYGTSSSTLAGVSDLSSTSNSINTLDDRRPFIKISYIPSVPCTNPPNTGTAAADVTGPVCPGAPVTLSLTGNTLASGITYEWESSPSNSPFNPTSISSPSPGTQLTINPASTLWYRAKVICNGGSPVYSNAVQVTVSGGLAGTFTINSAQATGGSNFTSFADAIAALDCGVSGPVVFNVVPNSGPYNEIVSIPHVQNTSPVNTVTFNGNGNTLEYDNTSSERQLLTLSDAQYIKIDSLTFKTLDATYGWAALITNGSSHDTISNCFFDLSSITTTTSANSSGICFSASATSANSTGNNGSHCYIAGNHLKGRAGSGGPYYALTLAGASDSNIVHNNNFEDYYYYGVYITGAAGSVITDNEMHRPNKTSTTTFYGLYTTGATPGTVITGNRVHDPGGTTPNTSITYGLYIAGDGTSTAPVKVYNNIVYNITQGGSIYGIYVTTAPYVKLYHNTITIDQVLTGTSNNYGLYATGTNTGAEFKNNNISITGGTEGNKYGFYYSSAASADEVQRNNVYVNSTQPGNQSYGYYTTDYATLAAFQADYPALENGSTSEDPQFVASATGNLEPANFLLYASGLDLTSEVPLDINGVTRISTPTPGAFEMPEPPINNAGALALADPAGAVCAGPTPVAVSIINAGLNTLNTVQVNWELNGTAQTPVSYTGPLYTSTGGQNIDTVSLGSINLTTAPATIKVWTSMPNGVADTDPSNDTLTFTLTAAMGGTYTIDAALPVSGTNYQSFAAFTDDLLLKGVCSPVVAQVNPASGPYTERVTFGTITGSSAVNTITIKGNGAVVEYDNSSSERQLLTLTGSSYITIDSLTFKALNATYGWGALLTGGCAYDSIINCKFDLTELTTTTSGNASGICFSASSTSPNSSGSNGSHCYIANNHIQGPTGSGGPYYGITVTGSSDSNTIHNNHLENFYTYGIYINGAAGSVITDNEVERATKTSTSTYYGIYTTGTVPGTLISGNRLHSTGGTTVNTSSTYGLYLAGDGESSAPVMVRNNVIYNITQGGTIYAIYLLTAPEQRIYHNTVVIDQALTGTSINRGIYATGNNSGTLIRNNIVSLTAGTGGTKYGFYYSATNSVDSASRNNIYVNSTQSGTQYYGYYTSAYTTQAAFQADYPAMEVGSLTEDPQFAAVNSGNLLPLNGNLYNNGVNLLGDVSTDITGAPRSATPTPGAYELLPSMFDNAGTYAIVNPSGTFCSGPRQVEVAIINQSVALLDSVEIHWTVNGVSQPVFHYAGPLGHLFSGDNIDTVAIGLADFPAGMPSEITVWTSNPNGNPDTDNSNDTLSVTVQPSYSVVVALGNDTTLCDGTNLTLDAGNPGAAYLWNDGTTAQTLVAATTGQYFVTVTDADACIGTDTLNLNITPLPVVDLGSDTSICPGVVLTLDAGNPGATYLWDDGSSNQTRDVTDEDTYTVTVTANNCTASDNITITLIDQPAADGINATYGDSATYTFYPLNPEFALSYTWNFGDGSPEVTGNFVQHTYTQNGIYTVTMSMEGICGGEMVHLTRTVDVFDAGGTTGIGSLDAGIAWKLYPNPGNNYLVAENEAGLPIRNAEVYNIAGQKLQSVHGNTSRIRLNTEGLAPGIYMLRLQTDRGAVIRRFEIMK